ncbi:MAG: Smr/MutS family protein [Lachnospiraceae bacterium]|nr:Smr/MutS family protein [Lachnospiraceae bacterium]
MSNISTKLGLILTKDEMNRIKVDGENISVDLHAMKVKEAKKLIMNIIALNREEFTMEVIHGYNHGTAIKNMVHTDIDNSRIISKKGLAYNLGQTELTIAAA